MIATRLGSDLEFLEVAPDGVRVARIMLAVVSDIEAVLDASQSRPHNITVDQADDAGDRILLQIGANPVVIKLVEARRLVGDTFQ